MRRLATELCALLVIVLGLLASCSKSEPLDIVGSDEGNTPTPSTMDSMDLPLDCDTSGVTFSASIVPLMNDHCLQCHSGDEPRGGVLLNTYEGVKKEADNGRLYGSLSWQIGYETMPQGADQLPACDLQNIQIWVEAGALNN